MTAAERFLAACNHRQPDRIPVWLLRQAGRYMAEYRAVRSHHSLLEICKSPALASEVTITAAEKLGVDAAIIFADLLLPAEPLGLNLVFAEGEGPVIEPALRTPEQISKLPDSWHGALDFVAEAISRVGTHFRGNMPVIGFAGAPFTLASYLVEGGGSRHFQHTKLLMFNRPDAWRQLVEKLVHGTAEFISAQVAAGAAAIQLFDSWAGALGEDDYRRHVLPHTQALVQRIQALGVPVIYFSTGTAGYVEAVEETGAQIIGIDWRIQLSAAWSRCKGRPVLQGNLDPLWLFATTDELKAAAHRVLSQSDGHAGYIFNLGHGILPATPVENVQALVQWVHEYQRP